MPHMLANQMFGCNRKSEASSIYYGIIQGMKTHTALLAALLAASATAAPTQALFFFDTEEYTDPKSSDAIVSIANMLSEEGVRGHFAFVGYLAKKLVDWRRTDVMDALKPHLIGTQTLYHSLHPNINEKTDIADFDEAYRLAAADEWLGIGMIAAALGREANEIMCAVMPGPSHSYVAFYLYADMGIPFFGGCGPVFRDGRHGQIWYCNQRHLPYSAEGAGGIHLEHFMYPAKDEEAWIAKQLDNIAKLDTVTFYMHPHMAIKAKHPDGFNWDKRNMTPYGKWVAPPNRDPLKTAEYYVRLRRFVRRLKTDPRFEITDCQHLLATQKPRVAITRAEVPAIRAALLNSLAPVESPASWCVADCFQAAVKLLRDEKEHQPGKVYGFLEMPSGVSAPVKVKAAALKEAARKISLKRFLPTSIDVGGVNIGPADFMLAALEVLESGADEVTVEPRGQLGDVKALMPGLDGYTTKGKWRYMPSYEDRYLSDRLRYQLWTLRYE